MSEGLLIPFGLTEKQYIQQLGRIEAATVRRAKSIERTTSNATRRMSRDFANVNQSASRFGSNGLRQVSLQLSQVGQQGAVTGDYLRALSIQMPDILLAFGTFGALAGAAAAVLVPFAAELFRSAEAADQAADAIEAMNERTRNIGDQVKDLTDLQETLNSAMAAQGDVSAAAAAATIANTREEIAVRKQRLRVELQLLAVDRRSAETALQNLQTQQRIAAEINRGQVADFQSAAANDGLPQGLVRGPGFDELRRRAEQILGPDTLAAGKERQRDILDLQIKLFELESAANEADEALNSVFEGGEVTGTGDVSTTGRGGGGRGGSRARSQVDALTDSVENLQQASSALTSAFESSFVAFVTGAKSAKDAARDLLNQLSQLFAQAAFRNLTAGSGFFAGLGSLLSVPSFAGGGYTGGGVRAGGIDGRGGFPAVLHPNETVIDHTRGGMGAAINISIDARGAMAGVGAEIDAALARRLPEIKRLAVASVKDAGRRGM